MKRDTLTINGQRVAYYRLGEGPPLLFLHGGRVEARTFKKLLLDLARDYTVFAPDIPGYGASDTPKEVWSFVEYAHFFDSFLQRLKLSEVLVVGYSMGGGIAFNLASISSNISRLVLVNASGVKLKRRSRSYYDVRRLLFYITHPQHFAALIILLRGLINFLWKHRKNRKQISRIRNQCLTSSYDTVLQEVLIPTTILWGVDDWIYPLGVARIFKEKMPYAQLVLVPGNHDWLVYDPLRFREAILT